MFVKLVSKLTAVVTAVVMVFGSAPAAQAAGQRALWVWDGPDPAVIEFALSNGISDLYLHTPPGFSAVDDYRSFVTDARDAGLLVLAMAGDPSWATDSGAWSTWVDEVVEAGGFDGVVFDVEPYALAEWNSRKRNRLIRSYLESLEDAVLRAGALPTFTTVPFWWDDPAFNTRKRPLVEQVLSMSDGIIVMAYRDQARGADGIIELSQSEVDLASSMGKQIVIGVETGPTALDKVSFAEEGSAAMEEELAVVEAEFGSSPGYIGISIHHYGSYSTMAR